MKKLITLTFALFFTAGVAFGQNNTAETNQSGNDNSATLEQTGQSNYAGALQGGNNGTAVITQIGNDNQAQDLLGDELPGLEGIRDQGDNNFSRIRQIGNGNFAGAVTRGQADRNDIRIDQGVDGSRSFNSLATVEVNGDNNMLDVDQRGNSQRTEIGVRSGARNDITVSQQGSENVVDRNVEDQGQERGVEVYGSDNVVDIFQDGSSNSAVVLIGEEGVVADFNTVDIMQTGDGHSASAMTTGMNNSATITQNN